MLIGLQLKSAVLETSKRFHFTFVGSFGPWKQSLINCSKKRKKKENRKKITKYFQLPMVAAWNMISNFQFFSPKSKDINYLFQITIKETKHH